jgi:succinoglycan biosynthesis transport protein ExoP
VSDPTAVQFVEMPPRPPSGPELQRVVLGMGETRSGDYRLLVTEEYRFLATRLPHLTTSRLTTLGIVSAVPGEGKTTVALGLAAALARTSSERVLLLEADLRQPGLERYLGLPRLAGVSEWLSGKSTSVPVSTISPPGFSVIVAGREHLLHPELVGSDRMGALLGACQLSFGYLVVDCPPLAPVADAVALQDMLDGFLLVVRAGGASRDAFETAVGRLKPGRIHGIVFNDRTMPAHKYTYGQRPPARARKR